jgi:hypothetical protein
MAGVKATACGKFTKGGKFYFSPDVWEWNLPAGHACPYANACKMSSDRESGKMKKGPNMAFPCYAAMAERFPGVRDARWRNYETVKGKSCQDMLRALLAAFPEGKARLVRIHGSGDFFSQDYFDAWLGLCRAMPNVQFWAFTKSIPFWLARIDEIPDNMALTASIDGTWDSVVKERGLRFGEVFPNRAAAKSAGLPVDDDDLLPSKRGPSFAMVLRSEVGQEKKRARDKAVGSPKAGKRKAKGGRSA